MSDTLTGIGSAPAGNPDGGTGTDGKGSAAGAAATGSAGPTDGQTGQQEGNLDWAKAKGWLNDKGELDTAKLSEGYQSLEKKLGTVKAVPDEKATPEEWDKFYASLGVPGEAAKYELARPDGLPQDMPYDEGMAGRFKDWAHAARLTPKQAQALHDGYVKQFAEDYQAALAEEAKISQDRAKAAHESLVKDWGDPKSETYLKNRDAAIRTVRAEGYKGLEDELKSAGLLTKEGNFTSPLIAKLLADRGAALQNETLIGNGNGAGGKGNPFAKATRDMQAQQDLIRQDPQRARALATEAGWSPEAIALIR